MKFFKKIKSAIGIAFFLTREYCSLFVALAYDGLRYSRHGVVGWRRKKDPLSSLEALIIKEYHAVEKGLAMPNFRSRFGRLRFPRLINLMSRFRDAGGDPENKHFGSALMCLEAYRQRHFELGIDVDDIVPPTIARFFFGDDVRIATEVIGGVRATTPKELFISAEAAFGVFAASRVSCREFDPSKAVEDGTLTRAVQIALRAPSVCNRQAWRVHAYCQRDKIDQLLEYQNGNTGFGDRIPCLLVITVDLECFEGTIERYQAWIEGGMFGMMMLLALHSLRIGAIPLNWDVMPSQDRGLRAVGEIPDSETIIMLMGAGHPSEHMLVPVSQRRSVDEIFTKH